MQEIKTPALVNPLGVEKEVLGAKAYVCTTTPPSTGPPVRMSRGPFCSGAVNGSVPRTREKEPAPVFAASYPSEEHVKRNEEEILRRKQLRLEEEEKALKFVRTSEFPALRKTSAEAVPLHWKTCARLYTNRYQVRSARRAIDRHPPPKDRQDRPKWTSKDRPKWKKSRLSPMYMATTLARLATEQTIEATRTAIGRYTGPTFVSSLAEARPRPYIPIEERVRLVRDEWKTKPDESKWSWRLEDEPPFGAATVDYIDLLLTTIEPTPKETIVFRGQLTDNGLPAVGQTTILQTILSTTFSLETAKVYATRSVGQFRSSSEPEPGTGFVVVFFVQKGARLLYLATGEQECILGSGCTMERLDKGDRKLGKHQLVHILVSYPRGH
jgi:hypothetical protein